MRTIGNDRGRPTPRPSSPSYYWHFISKRLFKRETGIYHIFICEITKMLSNQ